MAARHPSAEELIAALDSIIERYREEPIAEVLRRYLDGRL